MSMQWFNTEAEAKQHLDNCHFTYLVTKDRYIKTEVDDYNGEQVNLEARLYRDKNHPITGPCIDLAD